MKQDEKLEKTTRKVNATFIVSLVAIIAVVIAVAGASYAFFRAQIDEGTTDNFTVTTHTTDQVTFSTGTELAFVAKEDNFQEGGANLSGTTSATAVLTGNSGTWIANQDYYVYLVVPRNTFEYTAGSANPELLIQMTKTTNEGTASRITTLADGTAEVTAKNGNGTTVVKDTNGTDDLTGFDVTTAKGVVKLYKGNVATDATTHETTDVIDIKLIFVNFAIEQNANLGKKFVARVYISKDENLEASAYSDWENTLPYTITYNANGAALGSVAAVDVNPGSSVTLSDGSTLTAPSGKTFAGWGTTSTATEAEKVNTTYTPTADVTLYAIWK